MTRPGYVGYGGGKEQLESRLKPTQIGNFLTSLFMRRMRSCQRD